MGLSGIVTSSNEYLNFNGPPSSLSLLFFPSPLSFLFNWPVPVWNPTPETSPTLGFTSTWPCSRRLTPQKFSTRFTGKLPTSSHKETKGGRWSLQLSMSQELGLRLKTWLQGTYVKGTYTNRRVDGVDTLRVFDTLYFFIIIFIPTQGQNHLRKRVTHRDSVSPLDEHMTIQFGRPFNSFFVPEVIFCLRCRLDLKKKKSRLFDPRLSSSLTTQRNL